MAANHIQNTDWIVVRISSDTDQTEIILNFLFEHGAHGVEESTDSMQVYFAPSTSLVELELTLNHYLSELAALGISVDSSQITLSTIPSCDWNAEWKKNLKPIVISDTLAISPSWIKDADHLAKHVIQIDPQMAFGTGSHATTKLLLRLIEKHCLPGCSVMDIGTGSGILSIAAAKLGAAKVVAFDIDPIAVATARDNCRTNSVKNSVLMFVGTAESVNDFRYDFILINITQNVILQILPLIASNIDATTKLMFSGILKNEEELIRTRLTNLSLKLSETHYESEWVALVAERL